MSGLVMPAPTEPPDDEVDLVVELLRVAREQLAGVDERLARVRHWSDRGRRLGYRDQMVTRVLLGTREHEHQLWAAEVAELESRARSLGLDL
jgi:hypothetical protein